MILLTLLGFGLFFGSAALGYIYLQQLETGNDAWYLLILLVGCVIGSALSLIFAGRSKNIYSSPTTQQPARTNDPSITTLGLQDSLQKQNEIVAEWRKTNHMKDKMTMIKISTNAQKP